MAETLVIDDVVYINIVWVIDKLVRSPRIREKTFAELDSRPLPREIRAGIQYFRVDEALERCLELADQGLLDAAKTRALFRQLAAEQNQESSSQKRKEPSSEESSLIGEAGPIPQPELPVVLQDLDELPLEMSLR